MHTLSKEQITTAIYSEVEQRFLHSKDLAHGWEHVQRVYHMALRIALEEGADVFITGSAALLHDIGRLVHQKGKRHAELSVREARKLLVPYALPENQLEAVLHAILAHSFNQGVEPLTLEACVVRDADRLDALGAIGIMRWAITGAMKSKPGTRNYQAEDPFAEERQSDDRLYLLDHFSSKLLKLEEGMSTSTGLELARQRTDYMRGYLQQFRTEIQ